MYRRSSFALCGLCAFVLLAITPTARAGDAKARFDLPAESLDKSLREFAIQAHCNISYDPALVAGFQAPEVRGEYTPEDALSMILAGTQLSTARVDDNTIQVLRAPSSMSPNSSHKSSALYDAVPGAEAGSNTRVSPSAQSGSHEIASAGDSSKGRNDKDLQEIIVTGTHIRGTKDMASPVEVYTRADIDATGVTTVQQFLQTLPQNFNGGASENTISAITGSGQTNNTVNGSAPNLRGLGADATLVLINGHRVAPGNSDGSFVDVSMIPLTAIERVEIVTDGASAIYGSDAVGGVINFILRSNFEGIESRVQYGSVSSGARHDVQLGQTVGEYWGSGSATISYQYLDQTPLSASSRDYLRDVPLPFDLLPEQVQHAAFANFYQEVQPGFDLHADLIYSHRSTFGVFTAGDPEIGYSTQTTPASIDGYGATLASTIALPFQSQLNISTTYSQSDTSQQLLLTPSGSPLQNAEKAKAAIVSLDVNLDGTLAAIPTGLVQYAVGGQYRRETFGNTYLYPATTNTFHPRRSVGAGYVEFHVPLVGSAGDNRAGPSLELTLADRAEHYSDFGSTNNPQFGLIWKPLQGLSFRSTYGTSFKAPLLSELNPVPAQIVPIPAEFLYPAPGGTANTLSIYGGNPNLRPETATSWTVGLDFKPVQLSGFAAKLTFYDIAFKNQIVFAAASICECDAFLDASILGPEILQRNPSPAQIQALISEPTYSNPYNVDPASIGAIFDSRALNLSTVKTRGLDFRLSYKASLFGAGFETGLDGTRILAFDNQFTSAAPVTSFLNTAFNPTAWRLRGREVVTLGSLSSGLYLNFTNGYANNEVVPEEHIASWTTVDAVVSYSFEADGSVLQGVSAAFSVVNLAGKEPPYMANPFGFPISYDGANANALGRYFSLRLQKRW